MPVSLDDLLGTPRPTVHLDDVLSVADRARQRLQRMRAVPQDDTTFLGDFGREVVKSLDTAGTAALEGVRTSVIPSAIAGTENMTPEDWKAALAGATGAASGPEAMARVVAGAMGSKGYHEGTEALRETAHETKVGDTRYDPQSPKAETVGGFAGTVAGDLPLFALQPELGGGDVAARLGGGALAKVAGYLVKQGVNVPMDVLFGAADEYVKTGGELPDARGMATQAGVAFVARNLLGVLRARKGEAGTEPINSNKPVEARSGVEPPPTTPEPVDAAHEELARQAGEAQAAAAERPRRGTWQQSQVDAMTARQGEMAEATPAEIQHQLFEAQPAPEGGGIHLDDVLAANDRAPMVSTEVPGGAGASVPEVPSIAETTPAEAPAAVPPSSTQLVPDPKGSIYKDGQRWRIEVPKGARRAAEPLMLPAEPPVARELGPDIGTDWINELGEPGAEPATATPREPIHIDDLLDHASQWEDVPGGHPGSPDLQELPAEISPSRPASATSSDVQQMVGSDAAQLTAAAKTRDGVLRRGVKKANQIFNALVVPGDDVLLRSGPAGQDAVRTTRPIELRRAQAVGQADALYHDITRGMSRQEIGSLPLVLEGQIELNSPNVTDRVRIAIPRLRQFFDSYLARAEEAGTGVERRPDYFPHFREGPVHDIEKPLPEFQKFGLEAPSLHYHQTDTSAGYSQDLGHVMRRYAYNAETELQAIQAFGGADADTISTKIDKWANQIAADGGDGVLAKKILLEKFNMQEPELPAARKLTRDVAAAVGTMNTLTTPIRHLGKYVNGLSQMGFRGAGTGLAKIAESIVSPAARQEIRASGVLLRNSFDLVMPNTSENAFYRVARAMPWIKATKALDAGGRVMMYFGADPWIDETMAIARGEKKYLGSMTKGMQQRAQDDAMARARNVFGISDSSVESGQLTPAEREYARLAASDVTEFSPERGQLPYAATVGSAGRLFYNLRKFATSQANFMYNNVVKPATYGNVKPMARFLAGSVLSGSLAAPLLHMVNRQPDAVLEFFGVPLRPEGSQSWDDWAKNAMAVGALHNLGLVYLLVEGRDIMQPVPMGSAGLLGRGLHGAAKGGVNAARQSAGVPSANDQAGEDLPAWWDSATSNLKDMEGRNVKDVARSTQMTWLMRKWYREARGLQD